MIKLRVRTQSKIWVFSLLYFANLERIAKGFKEKGDKKLMIKIIEHSTRKEQRCENCGCLFSYEAIDIEKGNSVGICGMELYKTSYKFVRCPQCKKEIVLENVLEEVR